MLDIKTLFIITVTTARMVFPGVPGAKVPAGAEAPRTNPATKTIVLDLTSERSANAQSWAQCAVPEGLKAGKFVKLRVDLQETGVAPADPGDQPANLPKIKAYWGCAEAVPEGQPRMVDPAQALKTAQDAVLRQAQDDSRQAEGGAKADAQDAEAPFPVPKGVSAYWPFGDAATLDKDAQAPGVYALTTSYCGDTSVTLDKEQDFLAAIELGDLGKKIDLDKPIKVTWKPVPGALAYALSAVGGASAETVTWSSSSKPEIVAGIDYHPVSKEAVAKYVKDAVLLPPDATSCTIPAGIFKGSASVMLTMTAVGVDKVQVKDGIRTEVVVRSTASMPLYTTPYVSPGSQELQRKEDEFKIKKEQELNSE